MTTRFAALVPLVALLGGCSLTPEQQEALARSPSPYRYLTERSIEENGVVCRYSDGTLVRSLNRAASCP